MKQPQETVQTPPSSLREPLRDPWDPRQGDGAARPVKLRRACVPRARADPVGSPGVGKVAEWREEGRERAAPFEQDVRAYGGKEE